MTTLISLLAQDVVLRDREGHELLVPASGTVARLTLHDAVERIVRLDNGVSLPVLSAPAAQIDGLPGPKDGVLYLVTPTVLAAAKGQGRTDVVAPARPLKAASGAVVASRALWG